MELDEATEGHTEAEELQLTLLQIAGFVQHAALNGAVELRQFPPTVGARRLLDLVRAAFVAEVGTSGFDLEMVLPTLKAFETVREAMESDGVQSFANRLQGAEAQRLVVEVAHDMRSPLGSILLLVGQLRSGRSGALSPIQARQLGLIYSATFGLCSMTSDVLELARGGDSLVDGQSIPFSVSEVLQSVCDIVRPVAEEKGLSLKFVPPESDSRIGYPAALNRVLLNLTTNALKFTAMGGVTVTCTSTSRSRLEFSVNDTGRGIPPEIVATMFDAFRRRQHQGQTDYAFSSTGLGLLICRKLVRAMGGDLQVESDMGKGARFFFEIELPPVASM